MAIVPVFKEVKTSDIKPMPYNPPRRVLRDRLRDLLDSMSQTGDLVYPLMITSDYYIIDGHRRQAAAIILDWPTLPAIVLNKPAAQTYASINGTSRSHSESERLYVWLKCRDAVLPKFSRKFLEMQNVIGIQRVRTMADRGLSTSIYRTATEIARYVDDNSNEFIRLAVDLFLEYPIVGKCREAMKEGVEAEVLVQAVREKKDFSLSAA